MVHGSGRGPTVNEAELESFVVALSSLPAEEWQKRLTALRRLVNSIPDYSSSSSDDGVDDVDVGSTVFPVRGESPSITPSSSDGRDNSNNNHGDERIAIVPWYRSSTSVRRLASPLRTLLLDARSAVAKDATELIGLLMAVKLQPHPSSTMTMDGAGGGGGGGGGGGVNGRTDDAYRTGNGALETINGSALDARGGVQRQSPPPPAFVGRLLLRDLLPSILDLSKQTVKVIRTYGVNMTIDILPHCRVKSCVVVLLERMQTHQNRTVREDCARYLRCILETWPWDPTGNPGVDGRIAPIDGVTIVNSRKDERLSLDSTRQIGLGLGRTLSDPTNPVREEAKRGFEVLFRRFRPVWDEVMSSGVVRDVRLRKKLLEMAASRSDGNFFDDVASMGEMSLNSAVSGLSYASHRSNVSHLSSTYASRGMANGGVPSVIGTPKVSPRARSKMGNSSSTSSPGYMRDTGSSAIRVVEQGKIQSKEASDKYSINKYVTSTGHVLSTPKTPSPRRKFSRPITLYGEEEDNANNATQQPFASLLQTPCRRPTTPESRDLTSAEILRKRLSRRISGIIIPDIHERIQSPVQQLSCIDETEDCEEATATATNDAYPTEITTVALEVVLAHLSHIEQIEQFIAKEKDLLLDLNKKVGISITDRTMASDMEGSLRVLSEAQVCDYFESVHTCVDRQRHACEDLLREMERISHGTGSIPGVTESPQLYQPDPKLQRNLKDEFDAPS
jgi:hypothetical protein